MLAVIGRQPDREVAVPLVGGIPTPRPRAGEVRLAVRATALNHADLLQLRGLYPPPPGESEVPGLECAGEIEELGPGVEGWRVGDRVMALLAGGGHGEQVVAPVGQLMRVPEGMSFAEAAALPESALTAWTNLVHEGGLVAGETVLVTGATGGVGTYTVQLAPELGARVIAAARDAGRLRRLETLGASAWVIDEPGIAAAVRDLTAGQGVELVLDLVGGRLLAERSRALSHRGRLVLVGLLAGARAEVELDVLLRGRLRLIGSVLRARSRQEKADLVAAFAAFAGPRLAAGKLRPVVGRIFPFGELAEAYQELARGGVFGKIVVELPG